jgi:hypothetical protein
LRETAAKKLNSSSAGRWREEQRAAKTSARPSRQRLKLAEREASVGSIPERENSSPVAPEKLFPMYTPTPALKAPVEPAFNPYRRVGDRIATTQNGFV